MASINFKGRSVLENHHLTVAYQALTPRPERSMAIPDASPHNLIIQGDNLRALKALIPEYARRIDLVIIDPPYNTGNEHWKYNDRVDSPMIREWLGKEVMRDDLTRHDKWLCMMMPRLKLIYELMSDEGLLFVSIDDNEQANLKLLLDDIFKESNFVACLPTIMNLKGNQDEFGFAGTHEYVIVYAKDKLKATLKEFELKDSELDEWLEDEDGPYKIGANLKGTGANAPREKRRELYFPIYVAHDNSWSLDRKNESDEEIFPITSGREMTWRWERALFNKQASDVIVSRDDDGKITIKKKQRPSLGDVPSRKPKSVMYKPQYSSGNGTAQLKAIFEAERVFDNPKPLDLIQDIVEIASRPGSLVLDSFAGSGTTAHAVLAQNSLDGGKRTFIMIECEDYADSLTAERVRRVIKGVPTAKDSRITNGYAAGFDFLELGPELGRHELLSGAAMPSFEQLGRHLYYLATGQGPAEASIDESTGLIGTTKESAFFLIYEPDVDSLRSMALTVERLSNFRAVAQDKRLTVFAPAKFIDDATLKSQNASFSQIPYALYYQPQ